MKIIELLTGISLPINNEEAELLKKFKTLDFILKSSLNIRDRVLANQLVTKNVLKRSRNSENQLGYKQKIRKEF